MTLKFQYRHTIYASYLGYITQAIVNNLAPLLFIIFKESLGLSLEKITLLITLNFSVQLLVDLLSAKFVDKVGYKVCAVAAHLFAAAGLVGLALFPAVFPGAYGGLAAAVILYAVGGGLIEVLISPIVEACPTGNKASVMSLLHSFYCWGTVLVILTSTLFLKAAGKEYWRLLVCLWAVLPLVNALFFSRVPIARLTEEGKGLSFGDLFSTKVFWIFTILMISAGASEQAMSQWASAFAETGLGVSKTIGDLAGPCMFSILMGGARVFYARFSEKIDLISALMGSGFLCMISYVIAVFSPWPALSLVACGFCGLSVGILWPGVFSIASSRCPRGGTALFALLALAGDVGCSGGPTLVGMVSGLFYDNLKAGLLAALCFPLMLAAFAAVYRKLTADMIDASVEGEAVAEGAGPPTVQGEKGICTPMPESWMR